jgi:hypothetical protein
MTEVEESAVAEAKSSGSAPPYMSFKTYTNLLDKLREEGMPAVFDKSYFGNQSGSLVAQVRSTLRYFDLITEGYEPTPDLDDLVQADEEDRKILMKMQAEMKYPEALALGMNATAGQLNKVFQDRGLTGATVDKAVAFFLGMVEYLGIEVSPMFRKRRASNGGTRRRKVVKPDEPTTPPAPIVSSEDQQKADYVAMLMNLATTNDVNADNQQVLLDRIEKALGIGSPTGGGG